MKIKLLKQREDFFKIFQESVLQFLQEKYCNSNCDTVQYVVNDHLNVIYPATIDRNRLHDIVGEFKYHPRFYRKILQSVYALLAIRRPLEAVFSSKLIMVPMPANIKEIWVFIPGNHSIRAIDLDKNRCFVFLKSGFNSKFIESDVNIRLKHAWLKAPEVLQKGNDWYEEQRVVGVPWNRLSSANLKDKVIVRVKNQLSMLYQKTVVSVPMADYVSQLHNNILSVLDTYFDSLPNKEKDIIVNFSSELKLLLGNYPGSVNIDLVSTHGDFQPGNILCSEDDFWIIDWEYSSQRSIFYDALVFDLECRFPSKLSVRFGAKISEICTISNYLEWTGKSLNSGNDHYLAIFFLEDLLLRMEELSSDLIKSKSENLSVYLTELLMVENTLIENIGKSKAR